MSDDEPPTTDLAEIARRRIAKQEARREERARLLLDSETRAPRVVRISVAEARTIDDGDDPLAKNVGRCCFPCGHLSVFHHQHGFFRRCEVVDCECESEDYDRRHQDNQWEVQHAFLRDYYSSSWRFWTPTIAFLLGGIVVAAVWWFRAR